MKEKNITRTITTIDAKVTLANLETRRFDDAPITLCDCPDDKILDSARALIETPTIKVLEVKSFRRETFVYALSESDFIRYGKIIK